MYPDEWYGRAGMSLPNMTKEICNGWKCDTTIASVVLSSHIHGISAQLYDWNSSRIAQDDVISKPNSGGTAVQYHRDGTYISQQFTPLENNSVTIWLPLDDVTLESGTIEYIPTSHTWRIPPSRSSFHSSENISEDAHRLNFLKSLQNFDHNFHPVCHYVEIPRGGVVFHHQNIFHGSGINQTPNKMRRALVIHTLQGNAMFSHQQRASYIYGRYQLQESAPHDPTKVKWLPDLHETFFPVCWSNGTEKPLHRSRWLQSYCRDLGIEELFQ